MSLHRVHQKGYLVRTTPCKHNQSVLFAARNGPISCGWVRKWLTHEAHSAQGFENKNIGYCASYAHMRAMLPAAYQCM